MYSGYIHPFAASWPRGHTRRTIDLIRGNGTIIGRLWGQSTSREGLAENVILADEKAVIGNGIAVLALDLGLQQVAAVGGVHLCLKPSFRFRLDL